MISNTKEPTPEQIALIERFEFAYNAIKQYLVAALQSTPNDSMYKLVYAYAASNQRWMCGDGDALLKLLPLRNALVHNRTKQHQYLAVPLVLVVQEIENIHLRLINPRRVLPDFQRNVCTIAPGDRLPVVLHLIAQNSYSQFPIYDGNQFKGMLTENGITRWLVLHRDQEKSLIDLQDETVSAIMQAEEPRKNYDFVPRDALMGDVLDLFARNPILEAVIITHGGRSSEKPIGIATRLDIVKYI